MPDIPEDEFDLLMMERDEREKVLKEEAEKERVEAAKNEERWHKEVLALEENERKLQKRVDDFTAAAEGKDVVADLRTQVEDADAYADELEQKLAAALKKTSSTTGDSEEVTRLTHTLAATTEERDNLRREQDAAHEKLQQLEDEVARLKCATPVARGGGSDDLADEIVQLKTDNAALMEALGAQKNVADEIKELQTRLQGSLKREKQTAAELEELTTELKEVKKKAESAATTTTPSVDDERVEELEKELKQMKQKEKRAGEKLEEAEEEVKDAVKKVKRFEKTVEELREEKEEAGEQEGEQVKKLQKDLKKAGKKTEELGEKVVELKNVQRGLKSENTKLKKKEKEMAGKLEKALEAVEQQEDEGVVDSLKEKLVLLGKKYEKMKGNEKKYEVALEKLNEKVARYKKERAAVNPAEVAKLKKDLQITTALLRKEKEKRNKIYSQFASVGRTSSLAPASKDIERSFSVAQVQCRALSTAPKRLLPPSPGGSLSSSSYKSCESDNEDCEVKKQGSERGSSVTIFAEEDEVEEVVVKKPLRQLAVNRKRRAETVRDEEDEEPVKRAKQEPKKPARSGRLCLRI